MSKAEFCVRTQASVKRYAYHTDQKEGRCRSRERSVQTMETEKRAHIQRGPRERHGWFENGLNEPLGYKRGSGQEGEEKIAQYIRVAFSFSPALVSTHLLYHKLIYLDLSLSSCSQPREWQVLNELSHRGITRTGLIIAILWNTLKFEQFIQNLCNKARNKLVELSLSVVCLIASSHLSFHSTTLVKK